VNRKLITIVLGFDGARILGVTFKNETDLKDPLFCIDEVYLESGDWIDIGKPLGDQQAFPVTIKNLVFDRKVPLTHGTPRRSEFPVKSTPDI
ncbi:MAG: hypothetical protein GYA24_23845, partial [Candidatus Lokiarchaeota archaeon]|nr:hypothetical protein [Candidatus Lokiarchaeota archaeon]